MISLIRCYEKYGENITSWYIFPKKKRKKLLIILQLACMHIRLAGHTPTLLIMSSSRRRGGWQQGRRILGSGGEVNIQIYGRFGSKTCCIKQPYIAAQSQNNVRKYRTDNMKRFIVLLSWYIHFVQNALHIALLYGIAAKKLSKW